MRHHAPFMWSEGLAIVLFSMAAASACSSNDAKGTPGAVSGVSGSAAGSAGAGANGGGSGGGGGGDTSGVGDASSASNPDAGAPAVDASAEGSAEGGSGFCTAGDCTSFAGAFDGFLYEYPCASATKFDCSGAMCVSGALTTTKEMKVSGDPNRVYQIDFRVRGVTESKNYKGGKRRSASALDPGPMGGDLWYEGGTAPVSTYSSYELHVTPPVTDAPNDYFLNARDGTDEHDGTSWALSYDASIKVNGGGTITFKMFDSNCSAILNCGTRPQGTCVPRTPDLSGAVPAPPATFTQPPRDANNAPTQWVYIDVTNVTAM